MNKSDILTNINKYHLSGIVESVIWNVLHDKVKINFISQINSTAGEIVFSFPNQISTSFEEEKIGIFSTSALIKLLSIMQDHIDISFEKEYGVWMKMNISDGIYEGSYSLADVARIPEAPVIDEPGAYEVSFPIDKNFKDEFTKAYKALGSINRFTVEASKDIKFTVGNKETYANKISFRRDSSDHLPLRKIAFSGEALAEILKNNSDFKSATISVADSDGVGFMKVEIKSNKDEVIYYLIELEEV